MVVKKAVSCKRCDAANLYWSQDWNGKWSLKTEAGLQHQCADGGIKTVKCKYCNVEDLHWAEEINPITKKKRMVLNESYGLPHACDARIAFLAKEKQDKADKYAAEKKRIDEHPHGTCPRCNGLYSHPSCTTCFGLGVFTDITKNMMLTRIRSEIWPTLPDYRNRFSR